MFFELQLTAQTLGAMLRHGINARDLCVDLEFEFDGKRWVVDRLVLNDGTMVDRTLTMSPKWMWFATHSATLQVPRMQVIQPLEIHLAERAAMLANGPAPTAPGRVLTIRLVFDVDLAPQALTAGTPSPVSLTATFSHIDWLALELEAALDPFRSAIEAQAKQRVKVTPPTIDLTPFASLVNASDKVDKVDKGDKTEKVGAVNAGIQCDPARNIAALRFQMTSEAQPPPGWDWATFLAQGTADLTGTDDWALVVDSRAFERAMRGPLLTHFDQQTKVTLSDGPNFFWHANKGLHIYLAGEALGACPMPVDDLDLDFDAMIDVAFAIAPKNRLTLSGSISLKATDPFEVIGCAVVAGPALPFLGLVDWIDSKAPWWEYVLGTTALLMEGPLFTLLMGLRGGGAMLDGASTKLKFPATLSGMVCTQNGNQVTCEMPLKASFAGIAMGFSRLSMDDARGPVLAGSMHIPVADSTLNVLVDPLDWRVDGSCDGGFKVRRFAEIRAWMTGGGEIHSVALVDDPKEAYDLGGGGSRFVVTGGFGSGLGKSKPVGYPAHVKIISTAGCRLIDVGMPGSPITPERQAELDQAIARNVVSCRKLQEAANGYIIEWPDGPPPPWPDLGLWRIGVTGLRPGSVVIIRDHGGRVLRELGTGPGGLVSTIVGGQRGSVVDRLAVEVDGRPIADSAAELTVRAMRYRHVAWVEVPSGGASWLSGGRDNLALLTDHDGLVRRVDLTVPRMARLAGIGVRTGDEAAPAIRGISRHDPRLLSSGDVLVRLEPEMGQAQVLELEDATTLRSTRSR